MQTCCGDDTVLCKLHAHPRTVPTMHHRRSEHKDALPASPQPSSAPQHTRNTMQQHPPPQAHLCIMHVNITRLLRPLPHIPAAAPALLLLLLHVVISFCIALPPLPFFLPVISLIFAVLLPASAPAPAPALLLLLLLIAVIPPPLALQQRIAHSA